MPRYHLFGEHVSVAQEMEHSGVASMVNASEAFVRALPRSNQYEVEERGVEAKGVKMFSIRRRRKITEREIEGYRADLAHHRAQRGGASVEPSALSSAQDST